MEGLKHFSHEEHPLFLIEDVHQIQEGAEEPICYGCARPIISELKADPAYGCRECSSFFLHKYCAELPREITHPFHHRHPLVLLPKSSCPSGRCFCDACDQTCSNFTYNCSSCEFDIDILCAFADRGFEHPGHHHRLALQRKQASFSCHACGEEDRDQSYFCTTCPFWIHRSCAFLSTIYKREDHPHSLILAYNLPTEYIHYGFLCDVCRKELFPVHWVYYCRPCRYFVHLKCLTKDVKLFVVSDRTSKIRGEIDIEFTENSFQQFQTVEYLLRDSIRLPTYDFNEIIRQFVKQQGSKNQRLPFHCFSKNNDNQKQHLSIFHGNQQKNTETINLEQEIICDCCIQPLLSKPFYECGNCSYFFHSICLKLPMTIRHPCHLEHPLQLKLGHASALFRCSVCYRRTNGVCYKCRSCGFCIDIKCASLPTLITHEAHHHPLCFKIGRKQCSACNAPDFYMYCCEPCNFNLDYRCAQLPQTVKHRWDKHTLTLSFPPFSDHPDEFWCVMCEREIHPKFWLYHCRECDTSFHPYCIKRAFEDGNIKLGRNIAVGNHQHPLQMVCEPSFYSSCDICQEDLNDRNSYVCKSCKLYLCLECGEENEINLEHKSNDCKTTEDEDC